MSSVRFIWFVVVVAALGAGCPRQVNTAPDAGPSDDNGLIPCSDASECPDPATARCNGVCLTVCNGADEACPADAYCDASGVCAKGCRDSSTCPDGQLCVNGACSTQSAQCSSRCDCDPGQVCRDGACQSPPASCATQADCPRGPADRCEAYQCNGFTRQCFDPDPQPCTGSADCVGRPGCTGGAVCACTSSGACVPDVDCTAADESTTCGVGNYCDGTGNCQALPVCTQPSDCPTGLSCNGGNGLCERPQACTANANCTLPPNTFCDTDSGFCAIPNCINGGTPCTNGLVCSNSSGRCVTPGGASCTSDNTCQGTEYCDLADQVCRVGCRSNADCAAGQNCDGTHTCVGGGGGGGTGQFGDPCVDDTSCQAPMICGTISGTCAEVCGSDADCVACNARYGTCTCGGAFLPIFCSP
jgi:hypothetical protein